MIFKPIQGMTLLEVMVSLFILSVGFAGFYAMQFTALSETRNAFYLAVAVNQMRGFENIFVTRDDFRGIAFEEWVQQNKTLLPNAISEISESNDSSIVSLCWGNHVCLKKQIMF